MLVQVDKDSPARWRDQIQVVIGTRLYIIQPHGDDELVISASNNKDLDATPQETHNSHSIIIRYHNSLYQGWNDPVAERAENAWEGDESMYLD